MRTAVIAGIASILLASPSSASALSTASYPPPSGTYCSDNNPADCYTIKPTDQLRTLYKDVSTTQQWGYYHTDTRQYTLVKNGCWYVYSSLAVWRQHGSPSSSRICVFTGGQYMQYAYEQMRFDDIPEQDRGFFGAAKRMTITQMWSNGSFISQIVAVEIVSRSNDPSAYCIYYTAKNSNTSHIRGVALDRTPPSIMQACAFSEKYSAYLERISQQQQDDSSQNNQTDSDHHNDDVTIPSDTTNCGHVNNGNENVAVRTKNHNCKNAKNVLKSYSRTLRSPRGWKCNASMSDDRFKARCSKKQTARAKRSASVYGVWIRR